MMFSLYKKETGIFTGRRIGSSNEEDLALNIPDDCLAIPGVFNASTHRVDLKTGEVVAYSAPIDPDTEFAMAQLGIREKLQALDLKLQRYVAEKVAGTIDQEGERRFAELLARKAELRSKLAR